MFYLRTWPQGLNHCLAPAGGSINLRDLGQMDEPMNE